MKIKVICANCNKEYELSKTLYNKRIKRNNALYCSKECFYKSRIKKEKTFCYNCGTEILKTPYRINKTKNGKNFCSKSCANSYNNTLRKKTSINTYRRIAFEVYEHKCAICGWNEDERILEVHHKDENRKNNQIDNLIILCPICHKYLTLHIKTIEELLVRA